MEDILEELVGEIWDEHDEVIEPIRRLSDDTWQVDGDSAVADFLDETGCPKPEDSEAVTMSGFVAERLGKIPDDGDRFTYENWAFTVSETVNHRATKITVQKLPDPDPEEESEKDREKKNFLLKL